MDTNNLVDCYKINNSILCSLYNYCSMKMCLHEMKIFRTKMSQFTIEKLLCDNKILCSYIAVKVLISIHFDIIQNRVTEPSVRRLLLLLLHSWWVMVTLLNSMLIILFNWLLFARQLVSDDRVKVKYHNANKLSKCYSNREVSHDSLVNSVDSSYVIRSDGKDTYIENERQFQKINVELLVDTMTQPCRQDQKHQRYSKKVTTGIT